MTANLARMPPKRQSCEPVRKQTTGNGLGSLFGPAGAEVDRHLGPLKLASSVGEELVRTGTPKRLVVACGGRQPCPYRRSIAVMQKRWSPPRSAASLPCQLPAVPNV